MSTPRTNARTHRRAFTLIELMVTLLIVALLVTIVAVALGGAFSTAKAESERQTLRSIALGIERFRDEFSILPPLVLDNRPLEPTTNQPVVFSDAQLAQTPRYSTFSIPYYILGAAEELVPGTNLALDGVTGPGMTRVQGDGSFTRSGREFESFFDIGDDADRLVRASASQIALVDAWGERAGATAFPPPNAIRYYRWEPFYNASGSLQRLNVPGCVRAALGDGSPELNSARFAIVSAGPDGMIDDANPDSEVNDDNLVEVGR